MVKNILLFLMLSVPCSVFAQQDPTAPLGWYAPKASGVKRAKTYPLPVLQSIVCDSGSQCVAMLNDRILSKNQSVAGYKIVSISKEDVVVARAGKTWQLQLFNTNVRQ